MNNLSLVFNVLNEFDLPAPVIKVDGSRRKPNLSFE